MVISVTLKFLEIEYIIVSKGAVISDNIKPFIKQKVTDNKSGVTFLLLDTSQFDSNIII